MTETGRASAGKVPVGLGLLRVNRAGSFSSIDEPAYPPTAERIAATKNVDLEVANFIAGIFTSEVWTAAARSADMTNNVSRLAIAKRPMSGVV